MLPSSEAEILIVWVQLFAHTKNVIWLHKVQSSTQVRFLPGLGRTAGVLSLQGLDIMLSSATLLKVGKNKEEASPEKTIGSMS